MLCSLRERYKLQKANKGIFITTSRFTDDARSFVSQIGSKIVLIDGEQLTNLMIESDVGVSVVSDVSGEENRC